MEESRRFQSERYRDELRLFCYRMTGSLHEAEGLVEATFFKAGGLPLPLGEVEPTRTELFKIAARLCVETLEGQPPRTLPSLAGPPDDPGRPPRLEQGDGPWLEPFPDDLYRRSTSGGPVRYTERKSVSLSFIAAMQSLPPQERLCLILSDVLGWGVDTLAEALVAGISDTREILERARRSMSSAYEDKPGSVEPYGNTGAALLMRYLFPWEAGDADALTERLSDDVVLQLPPSPSWYEGLAAVKKYLASCPLHGDAPGRWRLLPRRSNGQLAFGVYRRDDERRVYAAHSIQVVYFAGELVSEIVAFAYPFLFPLFRLLPELDVQG